MSNRTVPAKPLRCTNWIWSRGAWKEATRCSRTCEYGFYCNICRAARARGRAAAQKAEAAKLAGPQLSARDAEFAARRAAQGKPIES